MAIALTRLQMTAEGPLRTRHRFSGSVAHFGSAPPSDKDSVVVEGGDVAAHHAKIFFAQGQFWLLNLCGLPCALLNSSGRTVFLTVTEPAVEIDVGDVFQIGNATITLEAATPPRATSVVTIPPAGAAWIERLRAEATLFQADRIRPIRQSGKRRSAFRDTCGSTSTRVRSGGRPTTQSGE